MSARFAVYFSPDDASELASFGAYALGRDATGNATAASQGDYPDDRVASRLRSKPAHYGFHATLKAPFELSQLSNKSLLLEDVEALASNTRSISLHSLYPRALAGFMALTLKSDVNTSVSHLASHCVERLESHRATLSAADIARRQTGQLSDTQQHYLVKYGYPFVMSEFQFHMTLTDNLQDTTDTPYTLWLEELFKTRVPVTPELDRLAVFYQADRDTPFTRIAEFKTQQ